MAAQRQRQRLLVLIAVALGVSGLFLVWTFLDGGFQSLASAIGNPWVAVFMIASIGMGASTAALGALVSTLRVEGKNQSSLASLGGLLIFLTGTLEVSSTRLPTMIYVVLLAIVSGTLASVLAWIVASAAQIVGFWRRALTLAMALLVFLTMIGGIVTSGWIPLSRVAPLLGWVREIGIAALPLVIVVLIALVASLRMGGASLRMSLATRWQRALEDPGALSAGVLVVLGSWLMLGIMVTSRAWLEQTRGLGGSGLFPLASLSLGWVGLLWLIAADLIAMIRLGEDRRVASHLASFSAKRFLNRYLDERPAWAASFGMRTSSFVIDHDPEESIAQSLPSTFQQIRAEEIQRCVQDLLRKTSLHTSGSGHLVEGALDAEHSSRPCLDVLKAFSCLYLDAGPLIERRVKGLVSLLPVVDPGLGETMRSVNLTHLLNRNQWVFLCDYDWVDQHVVHTTQATRYGVRLGAIAQTSRAILQRGKDAHASGRRGGLGNEIWLSSAARARLLQEAPMLGAIIETSPVIGSDGKEILMFTLRFEALIPRLQKHFSLESERRALMDFEPSPSSARMLNLAGLQMTQATSAEEVLSVAEGLASVSWRGFKEKDAALQLVLGAFDRLVALSSSPNGIKTPGSDEELRDRLRRIVERIGYPSQILHHAQEAKMRLRGMKRLLEAAARPRHARFQEAWVLLATSEMRRYTREDRLSLLQFLAEVPRTGILARQELVRAKAIEALAGAAREASGGDTELLRTVVEAYLGWAARDGFGVELCLLLIDTLTFIESHLGRRLEVSPEVKEVFARLVAQNYARGGEGRVLRERWLAFDQGLAKA